jgi:hypothetical protein
MYCKDGLPALLRLAVRHGLLQLDYYSRFCWGGLLWFTIRHGHIFATLLAMLARILVLTLLSLGFLSLPRLQSYSALGGTLLREQS